MRPKKRDREENIEPKSPIDQAQADHELFLQAFEKPTQIYRYLRARNIISPIFMHRTLSYMRKRMSRSHKSRLGFSVNSILDKVETKARLNVPLPSLKSEFLNITFNAFMDKGFATQRDKVTVEVHVVKICHNRRKDVESPAVKVSVGKVDVPVNPALIIPPSTTSISIDHNNFAASNGHQVKSYVLLLHVTHKKTSINHEECNSDDQSPPNKKPKKNGKTSGFDNVVFMYCSELMVYDVNKECRLSQGNYEVALQDIGDNDTPDIAATWETIVNNKPEGMFDAFSKCPTLKFNLTWSPTANQQQGDMLPSPPTLPHHEHMNGLIQPLTIKAEEDEMIIKRRDQPAPLSPKKKLRIIYTFTYNNNSRQQTESNDDLHCPWCMLNCQQLYSLLKHLRVSHARFSFVYSPHPKGAKIDVSINESYDGSYEGNPQDVHSHIGYAFCRDGPVRRTQITQILVYKPKKLMWSLTEFLDQEDSDLYTNRQFVQGHNRLYYHTVGTQPLRPCEIEEDSEEEHDPQWMRQKTVNLIDEFTDVNEGEKEVMKMWNHHVMRNNYLGDYQMPEACLKFVQVYGQQIIEKNLKRNLLIHLVNLFDFGLLRPELVYNTMQSLDGLQDRLCIQEKQLAQ